MSARAAGTLFAFMCGLAGSGACTDVADARASRDTRVGRASIAGISVEVREGRAAVRELVPERLHLWLQAPSLDVELTVAPGAQPFTLVASNALADVALEVAPGGAAFTVEGPTGALPTERQWRIVPPADGGTATLRLSPSDLSSTTPWRFAVFADVQQAVDEVQDIFGRMAEDPAIRFVVMSGDLTARGTPAQLSRFQREMQSLAVPIYATLGNHELGTRDDLFHDYFGRGNSSFVHRGVSFTLLDTASATLAPRAYEWLEGWLVEGIERVHYVFAHIPPLDPAGTRNGAFASRLEANKLVSLLASGKVDTTFYGHVHSYYAYSNAGIPAFITGGGGAIPEQLDGIGRHYLTVDVDPLQQTTQVGLVRID